MEHSPRGASKHYFIIYVVIVLCDLLFTTEWAQHYEAVNWLVDLCLEEMQITSIQKKKIISKVIVLFSYWMFDNLICILENEFIWLSWENIRPIPLIFLNQLYHLAGALIKLAKSIFDKCSLYICVRVMFSTFLKNCILTDLKVALRIHSVLAC